VGQVRAGNTRINCVRIFPLTGDQGIGALPSPRKHGLKLHLWMEYSSGQNRGGTPIDVLLPLKGQRPCQQHGITRPMRLSAFRFLYSICSLLGEVSVADGKRQAPPLLFPSATLSSPFTWRHLQNSGAFAPRERGSLSVSRHPEVAAQRPSKETAEVLGPRILRGSLRSHLRMTGPSSDPQPSLCKRGEGARLRREKA